MTSGPFVDRVDAGRRLGDALVPTLGREPADRTVLLLGLPRGGVVVAAAAAQVLGRPYDAIAVRKVGAPTNPELALGAVTADGTVLVNDQVARAEELSAGQVAERVAAAAELAGADELR